MSQCYRLFAESASDLPLVRSTSISPAKEPSAFVELKVEVDGQPIYRVSDTVSQECNPVWNQDLIFYTDDSQAVCTVTVRSKTCLFRKNHKIIGFVEINISELLAKMELNNGIAIESQLFKGTPGLIKIGLERKEFKDGVAAATSDAKSLSGLGRNDNTGQRAAGVATGAMAGLSPLAKIIGKLEIFAQMAQAVAQIHPFTQVAFNLLNTLYKMVKKQIEMDSMVLKLVDAMTNAYQFVEDLRSESCPNLKIERLKNNITRILEHTVHCINFIREYSARSIPDKVGRTILGKDDEAAIKELTDTFQKLRNEFSEGLAMETASLAFRIHDIVTNIDLNSELCKLTHSEMSIAGRGLCLADTRLDIIPNIVEWASDPDSSGKVLWLRGVIGSGKSTVANSLSNLFRDLRYLGAFLFFDSKSRYEPTTFVSTLAHQLAQFDQRLRESIANAVKVSEGSLRAPLQVQFNTFVLGPLQSAKLDDLHQPMLIIIDGLDQCGDADSRKELLSVLSSSNPPLPSFLRIIITSQPDPDPDTSDLLATFNPMEFDTTSEGNHNDIELYFTETFSQSWKQKRKLHQDWPGQDRFSKLVQRAGGLFLWSVIVAKSIISAPKPDKRIDALLNTPLPKTGLDDIYLESLQSIYGCEDEDFALQFKAVVGMIVNAREPLSSAAIDALRGCDSDGDETEFIITRLSSVLSFPTSTGLANAPIRTLHSSFDDFLCDRKKCGDEWYIDIALHHRELAIGCLKYLSWYFEGADPVDMTDPFPREAFMKTLRDKKLRGQAVCVDALAYAATYWPYHFCAIPDTQTDAELLVESSVKEVDGFLQRNLLHWFEFLSILNKSREASQMLEELCQRLTRLSSGNSDVMKMAEDAHRFSQTFADCIERHPGFVRLSALPFTPTSSILHCYGDQWTPWVVGGFQNQWQPIFSNFPAHTGSVKAIAWSPDDSCIASCGASSDHVVSSDHAVCVWDVATGTKAVPDLRGHSKEVQVVAFATEGGNLAVLSASVDGTIRTWDATTGKELLSKRRNISLPVLAMTCSADGSLVVGSSTDGKLCVWRSTTGDPHKFLEMHDNLVRERCLAFSDDGKILVSASADTTVRRWDVAKEISVSLLIELEGGIKDHPDALSVAISSDGTQIAAGLEDGPIAIWEETIMEVRYLEGHEEAVVAVDFSPNGQLLVSGSEDYTVRLWDLENLTQVWKRPRRHDGPVISVAFSHGGSRIAAGSADGYVKVWDASPQQTTWNRGPVPGIEKQTWAVAISPDGERVAHGITTDHTVLMWYTDRNPADRIALRGHKEPIRVVVFSSDGLTLSSGSQDNSIIVWDVVSGDLKRVLSGHTDYVLALCFAPEDSTRIASGSEDQTVRLWNMAGKSDSRQLHGHSKAVRTVAFSGNGQRLASGSSDGEVRVWDATSGAALNIFAAGAGTVVMSVAFNSAADRLFSSDRDGHLQTWDLSLGPELSHTEDRNFLSTAEQNISNPLVIRNDGTIEDFESKAAVSYLPPALSVRSVVAASSCRKAIILGTGMGDLYILCLPRAP